MSHVRSECKAAPHGVTFSPFNYHGRRGKIQLDFVVRQALRGPA
jgi:hypothetical protein